MQEQKSQHCANLLILQRSAVDATDWRQTRRMNFHLQDPNDLSDTIPAWSKICIIVADSTDIERCSQCRQAFADAFCMPHFWWSYYFRKGNGNFGCERTRDFGITTGFNTWSKFAVKKVEPDTKFKWHHMDIFTRWLPSTNQTVVLAFDLDPPIKERFLRAVMKPDESWLNDPFWVHPYLVEQVALLEEPSVWAIRDHVRLTETKEKPEGRPQPDYRRLHDIARHAIHVNETLDIALQNVEHILMQHENYTKSNADNDSAASEDIHFRLRSWQSFIANLRSRSISNEKRLQNEIQLAFNTVAQHDASVTLEIGRAAQLDSATMKTIAFVTLTFLPPTFICAIFSMSFFNFGGESGWIMSDKFWVYWVFAIPTTVFTTLVWTYWPDIRRILFLQNE